MNDKCINTIELYMYIRTRGRTDDAACTNAMGMQGDKRAILYTSGIWSTCWSLCL